MKNKPFYFHGAKFTIKVLTSETNGSYIILDVIHPPNICPALHIHPKGSETFYIVEGDYKFILEGNSVTGKPGDIIFVPKGSLHRFDVGYKGGHALVISPPELEFYFFKVSELLDKGEVSYKTESSIVKQYGQVFLDNTKHWNSQNLKKLN
ncbi:MAG: cupin domain-containing protein [Nitrososphaeraceae archaeon]